MRIRGQNFVEKHKKKIKALIRKSKLRSIRNLEPRAYKYDREKEQSIDAKKS